MNRLLIHSATKVAGAALRAARVVSKVGPVRKMRSTRVGHAAAKIFYHLHPSDTTTSTSAGTGLGINLHILRDIPTSPYLDILNKYRPKKGPASIPVAFIIKYVETAGGIAASEITPVGPAAIELLKKIQNKRRKPKSQESAIRSIFSAAREHFGAKLFVSEMSTVSSLREQDFSRPTQAGTLQVRLELPERPVLPPTPGSSARKTFVA